MCYSIYIGHDWKLEQNGKNLRTEWLNFFESFTLSLSTCFKYKNDNYMNIAYINCLQWLPQSFVRKILLDIIITPCTKIGGFVDTSYLVWRSQPSQLIAT